MLPTSLRTLVIASLKMCLLVTHSMTGSIVLQGGATCQDIRVAALESHAQKTGLTSGHTTMPHVLRHPRLSRTQLSTMSHPQDRPLRMCHQLTRSTSGYSD